MSAKDVELPAGWLTADTEAAARRIAKWQETDRQWTLRTRLALARALVPEYAVVRWPPTGADVQACADEVSPYAATAEQYGLTVEMVCDVIETWMRLAAGEARDE